MKSFVIRDDQVKLLRRVSEKLNGVHDGLSVIITATLDNVEEHSLDDV